MSTTNERRQLFIQFVERYLEVRLQGWQSGFGIGPDLFLFEGAPLNDPASPLHGKKSTLAVPTTVMLEPRHRALEIIQRKRESAGLASALLGNRTPSGPGFVGLQ